ncbi:MAG: DinB family protein [Vicinamibacterales bacterium]
MAPLGDSLAVLFSELIDGPKGACYILNMGDEGLLKALDRLTAASASAVPRGGGASIAAHVDHVLYGLHLLNRWVAGEENPWRDADWTASWQRTSVSDDEWAALREQLRIEARRWHESIAKARDLEGLELNGAISSVAHLAYHFGAIRQIDRSTRGPSAEQSTS